MANTIIQIKRSTTTDTPTGGTLSAGELAYSYSSNVTFIGTSDGGGVEPIGGKYYVDRTNSALLIAQTAFETANAAGSNEVVQAAFDKANSATTIGSSAFDKANSANYFAFLVNANTVAAFSKANSAETIAIASFAQGNNLSGAVSTANTYAIAAFTQANNVGGAVTTANNIAIAAFGRANIAFGQANLAFVQANNVGGAVTTANNIAIAAFGKANTAETIAVAAFGSSNTKLSASGGTISGDLSVSGNLTVTGNVVSVNTTEIVINDPILLLANNNTTDAVDIGFIAHYGNATSVQVHTGILRNHDNEEYYIFDSYAPHVLDEGGNIDINDASFKLAVLNADIKTSNLVLNGTNTALWITSAYNQANTSGTIASAAFGTANTANIRAVAAFTQANSVGGAVTTANNIAIAAFGQANLAFTQANNVGGAVTTANNIAIAAFGKANTAETIGVAAFGRGNTAQTIAVAAFSQANTAAQSVNLANATGTLAIARGGTNQTSFTNGQLIVFNGTSLVSRANGGSAGTFGNTSHIPVFTTDAYGFVTSVTNTSIAISAAQITSGTLPVSRGGTGNTTFTSKGVVYGNGTGAMLVTAAGTEGKVLQADGTGTPIFSDLDGGVF